jgi:hypothetical protein
MDKQIVIALLKEQYAVATANCIATFGTTAWASAIDERNEITATAELYGVALAVGVAYFNSFD